MGAEFARTYTSHGSSMKTANCPLCHDELTAQIAVIERITDNRHVAYAHAVASACGRIQLDSKTTQRVLNALADICNSRDFKTGWPEWCDSNFSEVAVAAALTLPTEETLLKRAKEAHRPTIRVPAFPGISDAANGLIEETLDDARWTTARGRRWATFAQFIHSGGVQSMRIRGTSGDREEKQMIGNRILRDAAQLHASEVVITSDIWTSPDSNVRPSQSPRRTEAFMVVVQKVDICTVGYQKYTRNSDGTVTFADFEWDKSGSDFDLFVAL
jgi:hypothetical protein